MRGPQGQKRPTNSIESAITVGRIATGDITEHPSQKAKGGKARAKKLSAQKRKDIAKKAAKARWDK